MGDDFIAAHTRVGELLNVNTPEDLAVAERMIAVQEAQRVAVRRRLTGEPDA